MHVKQHSLNWRFLIMISLNLQIEIVDKIISEEKQMKRKQQQQPQLWPDRHRDRVKVSITSYHHHINSSNHVSISIIIHHDYNHHLHQYLLLENAVLIRRSLLLISWESICKNVFLSIMVRPNWIILIALSLGNLSCLFNALPESVLSTVFVNCCYERATWVVYFSCCTWQERFIPVVLLINQTLHSSNATNYDNRHDFTASFFVSSDLHAVNQSRNSHDPVVQNRWNTAQMWKILGLVHIIHTIISITKRM